MSQDWTTRLVGESGDAEACSVTREVTRPGPSEKTCAYTYTPVDTDGQTREDPWSCHRPAIEGTEQCVFHLAPEECRARGITTEQITKYVARAAYQGDRHEKEFIGAHLASLDLSYHALDGRDNYPLDFSAARIEGAVTIRDTTVAQPMLFDGATVGGLVIDGAATDTAWSFQGTRFTGDVTLAATMDGRTHFDDACFEGKVTMDEMAFNGYSTFRRCVFKGAVDCYVDFNGEPHFTGAHFEESADFFMDVNGDGHFDDVTFAAETTIYAEFFGNVFFDDTVFEGPVSTYGRFAADALYRGARFEGVADFNWQDADYNSVRFQASANFEGARFEGPTDFSHVEFVGAANFTDVEFTDSVAFESARFEHAAVFDSIRFAGEFSAVDARFERRLTVRPADTQADGVVDLAGATLAAGHLAIPPDSALVYDLERASMDRVSFDERPTASLTHYRIVETSFNGFDFATIRDELHRNNWVLHESTETESTVSTSRLETTYLKAKNGATLVGENKAASEFFLRELRFRRQTHYENAVDAGVGTLDFWRAIGKYVANVTMALTCGYGEKPWRVIASSTVVIAAYATVYYFTGLFGGGSATPLQYAVLSVETFVELVLGVPNVINPVVNFLTATEAFLGAYFIALFVFTLTRSIHR